MGLLRNVPREVYLWKPAPEKWCILEVICHLYDEEREDFRARVKHTLETPVKLAPPIDPVAWVQERNYIEQDFGQKLEELLKEREKSVQWLQTLSSPNWGNTYHHPKLGPMTAGNFLANWLAHDYLHCRQITKLKYDYLSVSLEEDLEYAGKW